MLATLLLYSKMGKVWNIGITISYGSELASHLEDHTRWLLFSSNSAISKLATKIVNHYKPTYEFEGKSLLSVLKFLNTLIHSPKCLEWILLVAAKLVFSIHWIVLWRLSKFTLKNYRTILNPLYWVIQYNSKRDQ